MVALVTGLVYPGWIRSLFNGIGGKPTAGKNPTGTGKAQAPVTAAISEEGIARDEKNGVTVDFTPFLVLGETTELTVTKTTESYIESEDGYATVYDIDAGDIHELDG